MPRSYVVYTEEQRRVILATATVGRLTAKDVRERFGVNPHTYYVWRRKHGLRGPRGRRPVLGGSTSTHASRTLPPAAELDPNGQ